MRIFISWSGDLSKQLSEEIRKWLPGVIQAAKPYYTPDDISKGARWSAEIAQILEESRIGIICITKENLEAPWILFEAGALSKNLDKSKVVPLLFGVEPSDLKGPLAQFQAAKFEKKEIKRIIQMINNELNEDKLPGETLERVFEMWWPALSEQIEQIMSITPQNSEPSRSNRDILEEILMRIRAQRSNGDGISLNPEAVTDLVSKFISLIDIVSQMSIPVELESVIQRLFAPIDYIARRTKGYDNHLNENLAITMEKFGFNNGEIIRKPIRLRKVIEEKKG